MYLSSTRYNSTSNVNDNVSDPYEILNIDKHAGKEEIRKAYNTQMKQWHPDLFQDKTQKQQLIAKAKFMEIRDAYDIIMKNINDGTQQTGDESTDNKDKNKTTESSSSSSHSHKVKHMHFQQQKTSFYSWSNGNTTINNDNNNDTNGEDLNENIGNRENNVKFDDGDNKKTWVGKTMHHFFRHLESNFDKYPAWLTATMIGLCTILIFNLIRQLYNYHKEKRKYENYGLSSELLSQYPAEFIEYMKQKSEYQSLNWQGFEPSTRKSTFVQPIYEGLQNFMRRLTRQEKIELKQKHKWFSSADGFDDSRVTTNDRKITGDNMRENLKDSDNATRNNYSGNEKAKEKENENDVVVGGASEEVQSVQEKRKKILGIGNISIDADDHLIAAKYVTVTKKINQARRKREKIASKESDATSEDGVNNSDTSYNNNDNTVPQQSVDDIMSAVKLKMV